MNVVGDVCKLAGLVSIKIDIQVIEYLNNKNCMKIWAMINCKP